MAFFEVELRYQFRKVVGVSVHVVAVPRLTGAAMAAAIMGDAAMAVRSEEKHLVLEGVGAERPAMAEDDWLSAAPVLVVNLCSVLGGDGRHGDLPLGASPSLVAFDGGRFSAFPAYGIGRPCGDLFVPAASRRPLASLQGDKAPRGSRRCGFKPRHARQLRGIGSKIKKVATPNAP